MAAFLQNLVGRAPNSVLRSIFEIACDTAQAVSLPFKDNDPRLVLIRVCVRWANIVRSTASLWDNVSFTGSADPAFRHASYPILRQFNLCTTRSRGRPLKITFAIINNNWAFSIVDSIILPNIDRIKNLTAPIYGDEEILKFLRIPNRRFSILESVDISFKDEGERRFIPFSLWTRAGFTALRSAPRLRRAAIHILRALHPMDFYLPLSQLTSLDFGTSAMPPDVFLQIMRSTRQHLQLGFFHVRFAVQHNSSICLSLRTVKMVALRTLRLRLIYPNRDERLFSLLRLPVLVNMWIEMHGDFQHWHLPIYGRLLAESTRTLRYLRLSDFNRVLGTVQGNYDHTLQRRRRDIDPILLERLLDVISNVERLFLPVGLHVPPPTLEKFASCTVLPQLQELELGTIHPWSILSMTIRRRTRALSLWSPLRIPPITFPSIINLFIPARNLSLADKDALIEGAKALIPLGITFRVISTQILPINSS